LFRYTLTEAELDRKAHDLLRDTRRRRRAHAPTSKEVKPRRRRNQVRVVAAVGAHLHWWDTADQAEITPTARGTLLIMSSFPPPSTFHSPTRPDSTSPRPHRQVDELPSAAPTPKKAKTPTRKSLLPNSVPDFAPSPAVRRYLSRVEQL